MKRVDHLLTWVGGSIRSGCGRRGKACVLALLLLALLLLASVTQQTYASDVTSTSPRGDLVATAVDGGRIEIRPISGGNGLVTIQFKGVPVRDERRSNAVSWMPSFVFSPDGTVLASVCA